MHMPWLWFSRVTPEDIMAMKDRRDVKGLVRLLDSKKAPVPEQAAKALAEIGPEAVPALLIAMHTSSPSRRLGAVEALGRIGDERGIEQLSRILHQDPISEIRWAAAIALGSTLSKETIPALVKALEDHDRYVRMGAADALVRIGWEPELDADRIRLLIAHQDWEALNTLGPAAAPSLRIAARANDPASREKIVTLLAQAGDTSAAGIVRDCIRDPDPRIRWRGVLSAMDCGLKPYQLPRILSDRQRSGPNPLAAAILNFFFLGIGYNYIGKWWGFPVFMTYMTVLVVAQLSAGPLLPYAVAYPITAVLGIQTYYEAKRMGEW